MKETDIVYDAVIIGSGLGGLACGYILAKEGLRVCILEKNNQIGGSLQTYVRDKRIFDTGVHYVGCLDKGEPLHTFFSYFGIMDKLNLVKMDEHCFEKITLGKENKTYSYGMGYSNFAERMKQYFPDEAVVIDRYCRDLQETCSKFPMYNAEYAEEEIDLSLLKQSIKEYFESLTTNRELISVLSATNLLYAGVYEKTPFYVHAMVVNSYIKSSYRFVNGGSQIARLLARSIRAMGGDIHTHAEVTQIRTGSELAEAAITRDGSVFHGKQFISDVHPTLLLDMLQTNQIRNAYRHRINNLENTVSIFILNIVLNKNKIRYQNHNIYHFDSPDVWKAVQYTEEEWPAAHAIFFPAHKNNMDYIDSITVMTYMKYEEVKPWEHSFNTVYAESERGETYEDFKKRKAEILIDKLNESIPGIKEEIVSWYAATPLTYRDYIGTKDGSLYGILKDHEDPIKSFIAPRTRIKNVFITGQNLHMHGVHGVTVSAVKTCCELLDANYLMGKIMACKARP